MTSETYTYNNSTNEQSREVDEAVRVLEDKLMHEDYQHANEVDAHEPADMDMFEIHAPQPKMSRGDGLYDPSKWPFYEFRYAYREYFAEFWGTFILIFFGCSSNATYFFNAGDLLSYQTNARYLALTIGWGFGLAMGLYVSMGVSGGHLNPAVTFTHAVFKIFPWKKVPGFMLAQLLGAMVGAVSMYGLFKDHFDAQELKLQPGQTMTQVLGGLFCTYPNIANKRAVWSEFVNTMILMMGILGIINERMLPAVNFKPLMVGFLVLIIGLASGWCSGYAMNPARDLGPRLITAFLWGSEPFTLNSHYFVIPMLVPFLGALGGATFFSLFILPEDKEEELPNYTGN